MLSGKLPTEPRGCWAFAKVLKSRQSKHLKINACTSNLFLFSLAFCESFRLIIIHTFILLRNNSIFRNIQNYVSLKIFQSAPYRLSKQNDADDLNDAAQ